MFYLVFRLATDGGRQYYGKDHNWVDTVRFAMPFETQDKAELRIESVQICAARRGLVYCLGYTNSKEAFRHVAKS